VLGNVLGCDRADQHRHRGEKNVTRIGWSFLAVPSQQVVAPYPWRMAVIRPSDRKPPVVRSSLKQ